MNRSKAINFMVKCAMLAAIAVVLMQFEFPVIPAFPFLKLDFSDVPALLGGFALGPIAGVVIEAFKVFLDMIVSGTVTGGVGEVANFLIGASFVYPAALIYHRRKSFSFALISMLVATASMVIFGVLANYFILAPLYGMAPEAIPAYIVGGALPINLIKGAAISLVTLVSYKKLSPIIKKENLMIRKKVA